MSDAIGRRAFGLPDRHRRRHVHGDGRLSVTTPIIGTTSLFFVLIMVQRFFGDASYAIIGPYLAEVWPNRLRASGMGFGYGIGNLGKIIGPSGSP